MRGLYATPPCPGTARRVDYSTAPCVAIAAARFALLCLAFFPFVCAAVHALNPGDAHAAETAQRRFYRAAFVLSRLAPGEPWVAVSIPPGTERDDKASALLHHSDPVFVFTSLAREMDSITAPSFPAAPHYAALAYGLLGRHADAARCMARYMERAAFRSEDALFLMRSLYNAGEYTKLRDTAALWQKNDHSCNEERLALVWGSWINQRNYREALYAALASPCRGWYPDTLAARARHLLGEVRPPESEPAALQLRYPEHAHDIDSLWSSLTTRLRYP